MKTPELLLHNGRITTLDPLHPQASAFAIAGGRIVAAGGEKLVFPAWPATSAGESRLVSGGCLWWLSQGNAGSRSCSSIVQLPCEAADLAAE